jgi:hypothetical protein
MTGLDISIIAIAGGFLALFMLPAIRNNRWWRATVTPLASIIGSGFLVVAPLLGRVAGSWAVLAMAAIVALAYVIGGVIRFNIVNAEPLVETGKGSNGLVLMGKISDIALTLAYIISVAFYIRLLSSFVLSLTPFKSGFYEDTLATLVLAAIAVIGWSRGLKGLEIVETISVSVKLSIIAALIAALFFHNASTGNWTGDLVADDVDMWTRLRMLAGMLLVVQGFETSRYIGSEYPARLRHDTMRAAQFASTVIYLAFVALVVPILVYLPGGKADETAIIGLTGHVAWILPFMLIMAAFMSQLSAAIADIVGAGGLVFEETDGRVKEHTSYPVLIAFSIALIWLFDIFQVISIASRAFAFYYMVQAIVAFMTVDQAESVKAHIWHKIWYSVLALLLALIVLFALPAE